MLLITACAVAPDAAAAQQTTPAGSPPTPPAEQALPAYRARVLGVYDERSGDPVANARVSNYLGGTAMVTNGNGLVSLVFLPDGGGFVRIQKLGYEPQVIPVSISPSDTEPVTLLLRPMASAGATRLEGVTTTAAAPTVSPALRGFQERMRAKVTGYFIDDSTLRRNESHQLADVMRTLPGTNLGGARGRGTALLPSPRCVSVSDQPPGPPQVYLDGVPLSGDPPPPTAASLAPATAMSSSNGRSRSSMTAFDLSKFQVSDLAGVEWYPSTDQAPIEYAHTSERCGVLLLWTRER